MRASAVLIALLAVTPALGVALVSVDATPATLEYTPRPPIAIHGDANLTAAGGPNVALGVVAGTGTASDPYVISGWDILPLDRTRCGIEVRDTSAHLRIEANRVRDALGHAPSLLTLPAGMAGGVCLHGVENVAVVGNVIGHPNGDGVRVVDGVDVTVESNTITGPGASGIEVRGATPSIRVAGNVVRGFYIGLDHGGGDLVAEDNTFTGHALAAVDLSTGADHVLRDNVLSESRVGVRALHSHLTLVGNTITLNLDGGLLAWGVNATLHDNRIAGNGEGAVLMRATGTGTNSTANATGNWWGDASGPSGVGNGTGDSILVDAASSAAHAPWLETSTGGDGEAADTSDSGTLDDVDTTSDTSDASGATSTDESLDDASGSLITT